MADTANQEQPAEDQDVEIVPLPDHPVGTQFIAPPPSSVPPPSPIRSPLHPRFTLRQRKLQLIVTISVVILALAIVFASSPAVRGTTMGLFVHEDTPAPTLVPGSNLFYIVLQPAWGKVAIDGRVLARLPLVGIDHPLQLATGSHVVQWRAPPLLTQTCTVSVPPSRNDTCLDNIEAAVTKGLNALSAWVIRFSASISMLPAGLRASLIQTAQAALDTQSVTELVRPGELYSLPSRGRPYSVAAGPLRATLRYLLDTNPDSQGSCIMFGRDTGQGCSFAGQDCRLFCSDPPNPINPGPAALPPLSSGSVWDVLSAIVPTWTYTTLNGRLVAAAQSDDASDTSSERDEYLQPMRITWDGHAWHVTAEVSDANQIENPFCGTTQDEVQSDTLLRSELSARLSIQWYYIDGTNRAQGCLALLALIQAHPKTVPPSTYSVSAAYFLHRFGVLLAANALAHRLAPYLPVADTYEQQIAARIVAQSKVLQSVL